MKKLNLSYRIKHIGPTLGACVLRLHFLFPNDCLYLRLIYRLYMGRRLNLVTPKTFTEKLQWLKLYNRQPEYTKMVDKVAVKDYVSQIIGLKYVIPTYGVWDNVNEIDFESLPSKFVLKSNNGGGGGGVVICKDKSKLNKEWAKKIITRSMKSNIYGKLREWPYKYLKPQVIAEALLENSESISSDCEGVQKTRKDIWDYKFYCYNGIPKILLICSNRFTTHNFDYYDMDFNRLPITSKDGPNSETIFPKPSSFEEMKSIASALSQNIPHVRVDLYYVNHQIYFGELTFYDSSGFDNLSDDKLDIEWGSWIELPNKKSKIC